MALPHSVTTRRLRGSRPGVCPRNTGRAWPPRSARLRRCARPGEPAENVPGHPDTYGRSRAYFDSSALPLKTTASESRPAEATRAPRSQQEAVFRFPLPCPSGSGVRGLRERTSRPRWALPPPRSHPPDNPSRPELCSRGARTQRAGCQPSTSVRNTQRRRRDSGQRFRPPLVEICSANPKAFSL